MSANTPDSHAGLFRERPDLYDAMIDWSARLGRELPFYDQIFAATQAKRLLDVACGTGRHAAAFGERGLIVEGADASPAMIEYCRKTHGESEKLRWAVRPFDQPVPGEEPFDVAVCKGNSLALASNHAAVGEAISAMMDALRPGGLCVIGLLNLRRIPAGPVHWQKKQRLALDGEHILLLKGIHRHADGACLETVTIRENSHPPNIDTHASPLLMLEEDALKTLLRACGSDRIETFGSHAREAYDPGHSPDLILVARKG